MVEQPQGTRGTLKKLIAWLETLDPDKPVTLPFETTALRAWSMMGNELNWQAVPIIAELLGVEDPEMFVNDLIAIRQYGDNIREAQRHA